MRGLDDKQQAALGRMNYLIDEGWEYPEAEWRVHCETGIPASVLRWLYDGQFER